MYLGIDCGTQGTKALVLDGRTAVAGGEDVDGDRFFPDGHGGLKKGAG